MGRSRRARRRPRTPSGPRSVTTSAGRTRAASVVLEHPLRATGAHHEVREAIRGSSAVPEEAVPGYDRNGPGPLPLSLAGVYHPLTPAPRGTVMRKTVIWSVLVLVLALFPGMAATAAPSASGYVIGAAAPLTPAQVDVLKSAGAQVNHVYRNFGGANAAIPDSKLSAVRALGFVTSVTRDSIDHLASVTPSGAPLPGTPYWLDEVDAERNTSYSGDGVWVAVL